MVLVIDGHIAWSEYNIRKAWKHTDTQFSIMILIKYILFIIIPAATAAAKVAEDDGVGVPPGDP